MTSLSPKLSPFLLLIILLALPFSSCKKDEFITDGDTKLEFSSEEILFDTVFVSVGSVTRNLKVYNPYDQPIRTNIRMAGTGINFRMNVNGIPGRNFSNVEIRAKDSLWIFVEVTVDPGTGNLPFVISDSIIFETNGNQQDVDLVAWGQNAHFIVANTFPSGLPSYALIDPAPNANVVWDSILPYVIYGFAVVDEGQKLTITQGTHIHFYNNSGLWVYAGGTLNVQGIKDHPVVFQGTRRESDFDEEPGQWDRIWLNNGSFSDINYAIIKNGFIGLQCDVFPEPATNNELLKLSNTEIRNMSGAGIYSTNFKIKAWNTLITSCGAYACALTAGGGYEFTHCTFANFWNFGQRSTPSVFLNNFQSTSSAINVYNLDSANFYNCIIEGDQDDELAYDFVKDGNPTINYLFNHTLIKIKETETDTIHFKNICPNCSTGFSPADHDWMPGIGSGADNFGDPLFANSILGTDVDLRGRARPNPAGNNPDAGAIEHHP